MTETTTETIEIRPQPGPQENFLANSADIIFYGGAAGGGKTYALLIEPLRHIQSIDGFNAVIFRRTTPQITNPGGMWDMSGDIYSIASAEARESKHDWRFSPYGNTIKFSHMEYEKDRRNWDGSQIALIGFDQLEQFTREQFFYMLSRNRSTCGVRPYIRANYNPVPDDDPIGGWLHEFVAWYIDDDGYPIPSKSGVVRWFVNTGGLLHWYETEQAAVAEYPDIPPKSFTYILSTVFDNKILLDKNPGYLANLHALPFVERERLLNANHKIRPAAGNVFDRAWFGVVADAPRPAQLCYRVRYWDKAGTPSGKTTDKNAHTAGLMLSYIDGTFYIEDLVMGQWGAAERERVIVTTAEIDASKYGKLGFITGVEQEPGSGGLESADGTIGRLLGYIAYKDRPTGSKTVRAEPVSAQAEIGNIKLVLAPWNNQLLNILHNFPEGIKDPVDALSGAFSGIVDLINQPQDGIMIYDDEMQISPV
jgi:predicted phage terminase large subunit-like protein